VKTEQSFQTKISFIFLFLGYSIFGFSIMFSKIALNLTSPFVLIGARFGVAFLILNILLIFRKKKLHFKGKKLYNIFLLGLVQPVLYFICESYGITMLQTSFVGIILALIPITSFVFGFFYLKEKVKPIQIVFAIIAILGVCLTTIGQSEGQFSWIGFVLILGAVISAAMFNVLSRKIATEFSAFERTYIMFFIGFITFVPIGLIESIGSFQELIIIPFQNVQFWISVVFLAGLSSVLAFLMINYAMTHLEVAKAAIFANLTTVIAILAGVLFLDEHFGIFQIIGSCIIVLSVYGVNRFSKKKRTSLNRKASF